MNRIKNIFWSLVILRDTKGQDLIEYAMLAGFVVIAIYVVLPTNIMPAISTIFSKIAVIFASTP